MMPQRNVPLPMAEHEFLKILPSAPPNPSEPSEPDSTVTELCMSSGSLLAHSVSLNQIFSQIDKVNSQAVSGELHGVGLIQAVEHISLELETWASNLPDQMHNTPDNLAYWVREDSGSIFVLLHIQYHHFSQLLFYQFLHGSTEPTYNSSATYKYAQKCKRHATDLCSLIHYSLWWVIF
jgi:hypothetical protein